PDCEAALLFDDSGHLGDLFDVDDHAGRPEARLHLDQKTGRPRQDVALALGRQHELDGFLDGFRSLVLDFTHAWASPVVPFGENASKPTARPRASFTRVFDLISGR